jgi:hypothetical protein
MAEHHDNTKPASTGTISIGKMGVMSYFPIEQAARLKPAMALYIHERTDGSLFVSIDTKWLGDMGELDE